MKNYQNQLEAFQLCNIVYSKMRLSQCAFLWAVACKEGSTLTEIADRIGMTLGGVSRCVDVFGSKKKHSERHKNLGLVEIRDDLKDDRLQLIYLTKKGWGFIELFDKTFFCEI